MTDSAYFVKTTPLTSFVGSFQNFVHILRHIEDMQEGADTEKKYFLTKWQDF